MLNIWWNFEKVNKIMNKKALLGASLLFLFALSAFIGQVQAQDTEVAEVFSLNLLSPNTSAARNQWSLLMENQLPKIGIGVDFHESTGWGNIGPRTWSYPLIDYDYIPTYAEGGFDILFVGWSWGLDWDPTGLFDSASIVPYGDNFYQYINPTYDGLLNDYLTELDQEQQILYGQQMQQILYEDLPDIVLVYPKSLFGFKEGMTGIDPLLLGAGVPRYEYWDDPADHIIKYAIPANLAEWNTYVQESFYDTLWMQGVYGALYQRQQDSHIYEPQIAADMPTYTDDLKSMSVDIDPNAKFSNGDPVTADDVVYSLHLHMTPAVGSSSYSYFNTWFASNASVYAADADTVCFNMTDVNAFALGTISYSIVEKSVVEALIAGPGGYGIFNEPPLTGNVGDGLVLSCGPFMLDSFDTVNSVVTLVPNPEYVGTAPSLTQWILTYISGKDTAVSSLIAGDVDITDGQYFPQIADFTPAGVEGVLVSDPSHQEMALNLRHPVFGTGELTPVGTPEAAKDVRKAISHAVPRDIIVSQILEGLGDPGITACPNVAVCFDSSLQPYAYDIDTALDFMELAGFDVRVSATGISGLIFLSFLGLASVLAFRRFRK